MNKKTLQAGTKLVPSGKTNLYRNRFTGIYYGRAKINGVPVCFSLDTDKLEGENGAVTRLARELDARRTNAANGFKSNDDLTFGECLDRYLGRQQERLEIKTLCESSVLSETRAKDRIYREFGNSLRAVRVQTLASNFEPVRKKFLALHASFSSGTVNTIKRLFSEAFKVAIETKVCVANPADGLPAKSQSLDKKREVPDDSEVQELLTWLATPRPSNWQSTSDLVQFLCFFGCRIDEANHVLKSHVDLDEKREGTDAWSPTILFVKTKSKATNRRTRRVPLFPDALPLVKRLLADESTGDSLLAVKTCRNTLATAAEALEQPKWGHHTFRHVFASRALEATKCDYFTVAAWLGHSDGGKLLAKLYAHLNQAHSQAQAKLVTWKFAKLAAPVPPPVVVQQVAAAADPAAEIAKLRAQIAALEAGQPSNVIQLQQKAA
jgi:integrase